MNYKKLWLVWYKSAFYFQILPSSGLWMWMTQVHWTEFSLEYVVNSEDHPLINHLHSRSFTDARLLTIPFHWQWAEHSLNKIKCAQTRVVRDTYLFIGLFVGKARPATLINKPQDFSGLSQGKGSSPSCDSHWRCDGSLSNYLAPGDSETRVSGNLSCHISNRILCCLRLDGEPDRELFKSLGLEVTHTTSSHIL